MDAAHQVGHVGEVAVHLAVVVDVDRRAFENALGELEQRHVRAAPRAVDREEAEHGRRQVPQVRVTVPHRLVRLLGRGVERELRVALLALIERHLLVRAVDRARAGHEQMLDSELACTLHHVERADDIGVDIGARVFERIAYSSLRREMDDHVGPLRHGKRVEFVEVLQHPDVRTEMLVLQQHLVPPLLDPDIVVIGHAVVANDGETFLKQQLGQVEADKPGAAGDEDFAHLSHLPVSSARSRLALQSSGEKKPVTR